MDTTSYQSRRALAALKAQLRAQRRARFLVLAAVDLRTATGGLR